MNYLKLAIVGGFGLVCAAGGFWVRGLFPEELFTTVIHRHPTHVVEVPKLKVIEKWKERRLPCAPLTVVEPPSAKKARSLEARFLGKIDLNNSWLLEAREIPGSRYGHDAAVTVDKQSGESSLTLIALPRPLFGVGDVRRVFLGVGREEEPKVAAGLFADGFRVGGVYGGALAYASYGQLEGFGIRAFAVLSGDLGD